MAVSCSLLLSDSHRSVVGQVQRTTRANLAYSPYGRCSSAGHVTGRLGFTGQLHEPLLDAYALGNGHRFYSVALSRFQRPDALSPFDKGGIHGYGYCGGDPVNREDPTGQFSLALLPGVSTGISGLTLLSLVGLQVDKKPAGNLRRATQFGIPGAILGVASGIANAFAPDSSVGNTLASIGIAFGAIAVGYRVIHYYRGTRAQGLSLMESWKRLRGLYLPSDHTRLRESYALYAQHKGISHLAQDYTKEAFKRRAEEASRMIAGRL